MRAVCPVAEVTCSSEMSVVSGVALISTSGVSGVSSATVTTELDSGRISAVVAVLEVDSTVFRDSAKTVAFGSRMPREISSEFQRSFMRGVLGCLVMGDSAIELHYCKVMPLS